MCSSSLIDQMLELFVAFFAVVFVVDVLVDFVIVILDLLLAVAKPFEVDVFWCCNIETRDEVYGKLYSAITGHMVVWFCFENFKSDLKRIRILLHKYLPESHLEEYM